MDAATLSRSLDVLAVMAALIALAAVVALAFNAGWRAGIQRGERIRAGLLDELETWYAMPRGGSALPLIGAPLRSSPGHTTRPAHPRVVVLKSGYELDTNPAAASTAHAACKPRANQEG